MTNEVQSNRGGSRPGAGAPRGNANRLIHGRYSKRWKMLKQAIADAQREANNAIDRVKLIIEEAEEQDEITDPQGIAGLNGDECDTGPFEWSRLGSELHKIENIGRTGTADENPAATDSPITTGPAYGLYTNSDYMSGTGLTEDK